MNPLGSRARAEELARLLEGALEGRGTGSPTPATGPAALALRLRALAPAVEEAVPLRPEFRAALRQRLVAVATVQGPALDLTSAADQPGASLERALAWTRSWTAQKRIAAVSGAMAGVIALTGVGVASTRSLPGQPFYSLKRASESLQLQLTDGDAAKGAKHLEFAATRLREVQAMAHGDQELALGAPQGGGDVAAGVAASLQSRITATLADFNSETAEGRTLLEGVFRRTGKTAPLRVLATFATQQQSRLTTLIPELPAGTSSAAERSLQLVVAVGNTATQLLVIGTCDESCDPDAAGPELPVEPGPTPGTSASPTPDDSNGTPPCACGEPSLAPEPSSEPTESPEPSPSPTPSPTSTPTSTESPSPGIIPTILPSILPTDLPTILPTLPPPLPSDLPSLLPSLVPGTATEP